MKTGKKFLCILLILVMAVFLFTGCGKKKTNGGGTTTLEGTWRLMKNEIIVLDYGQKIDIPYPIDETEWDVTVYTQPYLQFKNNKVITYKYIKIEILNTDTKEPVNNDLLNNIIK